MLYSFWTLCFLYLKSAPLIWLKWETGMDAGCFHPEVPPFPGRGGSWKYLLFLYFFSDCGVFQCGSQKKGKGRGNPLCVAAQTWQFKKKGGGGSRVCGSCNWAIEMGHVVALPLWCLLLLPWVRCISAPVWTYLKSGSNGSVGGHVLFLRKVPNSVSGI